MKKFGFIFSIMVLALIFSTTSAQAQDASRVGVKVPFDFNIGDKTYAAGNYTLHVRPNTLGVAALTIEDETRDQLQTVLVASKSGNVGDKANLLFDRLNGRPILTGIVLSNNTYTLARSSSTAPAVTKNRNRNRKEKEKEKVKTT